MRASPLPRLFLCLAFAGAIGTAKASHIVAAEIDLRFISGNQYEVRLLLWRDCQSTSMATGYPVAFSGCSTGNMMLPLSSVDDVSPLCPADLANSFCNGGNLPGFERYTYSAIGTFAPCSLWTFQWDECCLAGTGNLVAPNADLVTHTTLNNMDLMCRDTPRFAHPGPSYMPSDGPFSFDMLGVLDGLGVAEYALVPLLNPGGTPVPYTPPYSGAGPYEGMSIASTTGIVSTDSTGISGVWMIVARLEHQDGNGTPLATVERAFSMPTVPLQNSPPLPDGLLQYVSGSGTVTGDRTIDLQAGGSICVQASYFDANLNDSIFLTSDIATALPGSTFNNMPGNPAGAIYCWTAPMGAYGTYRFITKASDMHCPVDGRQYFLYSVRITPDTVGPCLNVGINETAGNNEGMVVVVDAAHATVAWQLPGTASADHMTVFDPRGRVICDSRVAPSRSGTLQLPANLANGVYVIECGAYRSPVMIVR